ncbi:MAG: hypothetical protein KAR42_09690 [candidate division Zixibacteria bacterium]|nr:hypothetical protein [candidate division Zixibacteria bacterium]
MPKRKEEVRYARVGVKDVWHPYGLQCLNVNRFAKVTNLILRGRFDLINRDSEMSIEGQSSGN